MMPNYVPFLKTDTRPFEMDQMLGWAAIQDQILRNDARFPEAARRRDSYIGEYDRYREPSGILRAIRQAIRACRNPAQGCGEKTPVECAKHPATLDHAGKPALV